MTQARASLLTAGIMIKRDARLSQENALAESVRAFYEAHPYPPPIDDLDRYRQRWDDPQRRRADYHLFWPAESYREHYRILIAGCGTSQTARHALRWPAARITGIDVSASSMRHTAQLKRKYGLANLDVRQLALEHVGARAGTARVPPRHVATARTVG